MRNVEDTIAFLRQQHTSGSTAWYQLCQSLARQARGLPAVYPSALASQEATPREHRYYDLDKVKRGMVMYFDDPNDSNPYGHIVTAATTLRDDGSILTWTNDARGRGRVDLVRHTFFPQYWGDKFQFAATWLNGYDLTFPEPKPTKPLGKKGQERIKDTIQELEGMIERHERQNHTRLVRALKRDVRHLKSILKEFSR